MHIFTCQKFCISPVQKSMKITHYRTQNLSRCDRIPSESKGVTSLVRLWSNQLSVSPWDAALKKPVQSSLISVTPGTRIFECDYISLYLHNWAVLRLCIVFLIGESPRVCSKYSHWYYLLLIWGGAKVSSIAIELLLQDQKRKFWRFFFFFLFFAHGGQPLLLIRLFSGLKLL